MDPMREYIQLCMERMKAEEQIKQSQAAWAQIKSIQQSYEVLKREHGTIPGHIKLEKYLNSVLFALCRVDWLSHMVQVRVDREGERITRPPGEADRSKAEATRGILEAKYGDWSESSVLQLLAYEAIRLGWTVESEGSTLACCLYGSMPLTELGLVIYRLILTKKGRPQCASLFQRHLPLANSNDVLKIQKIIGWLATQNGGGKLRVQNEIFLDEDEVEDERRANMNAAFN
eukprot:Gregarina_sp_Pseudo_9__1819@NODE_2239_length_1083_cov_227_740421_g2062_i0_p1_GENE_NODE_2239_length_1083_cov_227_740421_g2062_i0NODE_2239_length_1083_cov_227_740421_g2062_i0_p1_ORF_typecomplete_len231_score26_72_NODE_2239_length_1083_cov_227_740421_g2062_i0191883